MANIPPGYAQINLIYGGVAMPRGAQNALGAFISPFVGDTQALADSIANEWKIALQPALPSTVRMVSVRVKKGPNATGSEAVKAVGVNGSRSTDVDAPNVCALVRKVTASGGRTNRGRLFHPGVAEGGTDAGGVLQSGERTLLQARYDLLVSNLVAINVGLVILHTALELVPTPITSLAVQDLVATQRRRLRKVGGRRRSGG